MGKQKRASKTRNQFNNLAPIPKAPRDNTFDIIHGKKIKDPFRPLEKMESIDTHDFIRGQNERFEDLVKDDIAGRNFAANVAELMNTKFDGMPRKVGPFYYHMYNDGSMQQNVLCIRNKVNGKSRSILDPNKVDPSGKTAIASYSPSPNGKYLAFVLSQNGSDIDRLHILNIKTGRWHSNKIDDHRITKVAWDANSRGFRYSYQSHDRKTLKTRHHKIGNPTKFDKRVKNPKWLNSVRVKKRGLSYSHMMVSTANTPRGSLVVKDPKSQKWSEIVSQHKCRKMVSAHEIKGGLLIHWLDDSASKMTIHDYNGKYLRSVPLPDRSHVTLGARFNRGNDILMSITDHKTLRPKVYRYNIKSNRMRLFTNNKTEYKIFKNFVVERHYAKSKDGTKVPMTVIRRKDVKLDGTAATKLYGYGGFNNARTPALSENIAQWVQEGGIYVDTNLRGGGEFGEDWYKAGKLENKQNVFDDFAACAEYLVKKKFTSPERLCSSGGSNGGLLTLATMMQRPDLFGAVISSVPVTDMFRFDRFGAGIGWRGDYGDIKKLKSHFNAAAAYSPLHNIKSDVIYPPTLVMTSDQDDRVVPLHSYKYLAAMNDISPLSPVFMRVARNQGHGFGKSRDQLLADRQAEHAFLVKALGPIDQKAYKADLKKKKSVRRK